MTDDSKRADAPSSADEVQPDGRLPSSQMRSYAMLSPELKQLYMGFYKATYGKTQLDIKTKEFVAIAAALTPGCKGCLEGHPKKAKKEGAYLSTSSSAARTMRTRRRYFYGPSSPSPPATTRRRSSRRGRKLFGMSARRLRRRRRLGNLC